MAIHKITYRPLRKVEDIDDGMKTIINRFQYKYLYVSKRNKSFPIYEIQELNSENLETVETILQIRTEKIRKKILSIAKDRKIYLLFGIEFKRTWKSFTLNKEKIITKEFVCLYIPGLDICPGIYAMNQEVKKITHNPGYN